MEIITDIPKSVMQLSEDFELVVPKQSKDLGVPDIESLTRQQRLAFDLMDNYVEAPEPPYAAMLLEGYAGTGKSHTMGQLIKKTILMRHQKIAISAPTNKAVKVIKKLTGYSHTLLEFKTIHSLMGLKLENDDKGKEYFVSDPMTDNTMGTLGLLIIDESSMLNNDLFLGNDTMYGINHYIKKGLRTIFVGDPLQIPPVNEPDAIPFNETKRQEHDIYRVALTDVVRQAADNPILALATKVRSDISASQIDFPYRTNITGAGGIVMINKKDKEELYKTCGHYFGNVRFKLDSDFVKVIAWTNKVVDFMNDKIRPMIYPHHEGKLPKIMIGEKLLADKPIFVKKLDDFKGEKNVMVFTTNDEFEVMKYTVQEVTLFGEYRVSVYHTTVTMTDETGKRKTEVIDILHENSELNYNHILEQLKTQALKEKDAATRKKKWRTFFMVRDKLAHVKYNYAITAHKSQGSTYENAIVIETDIDNNPRIVERNRIKYVAYTRAKSLLFIVK
jgi:exodeoxyribonuclease-5